MKRTMTLLGLLALAGGSFLAGGLTAQEKKSDGQNAVSPDQQAMMEAWLKASQPNEHHARLGKMAGKWKMKVSSWYEPGAEPEVSEATASCAPIMGGRFMLEQVNGAWGDLPFEGMSLSGYNNLTKRYETTWCDSMTTGIVLYTGEYDSKLDAIVQRAEYLDPMTNQNKKSRTVTRWTAPDRMVMEFFGAGPDGKEHKEMEIVYTKQ